MHATTPHTADRSQPSASGRQDLLSLAERGVSTPEEFAALPEQVIVRHVQRYDNDPDVTVGALVFRLRQEVAKLSRPASPMSRDLMAREAEYGREIVQTLTSHFPELCGENGPHPAAVAAVIRLHWRNGRGNLRVKRDGSAVRAAVAEFNRRWFDDDGSRVTA